MSNDKEGKTRYQDGKFLLSVKLWPPTQMPASQTLLTIMFNFRLVAVHDIASARARAGTFPIILPYDIYS